MHGWENLRDEDRETILRGIEEGRALGGPYHVELDMIDVCNVECFFCSSVDMRQGAVFKWDRLEPRIDEMIEGGLRSFRISGGGEPLLYPQLGELLQKMGSAGVVMDNMTTNAIRLERWLDDLMKVQISNCFVSLNYTNPQRYARFMQTKPDRFDIAVNAIRALDRRLREEGKRDQTNIMTQFFVHHSTVDDLDAMMDLALDLPVDCVNLRTCVPDGPEGLTELDCRKLIERLPAIVERSLQRVWLELHFDHVGLRERCNEILIKGRSGGLGPEVERQQAEKLHLKPGTIEWCYIGWYSMLVQGTGDVHPCCFLFPEPSVPAFGNLNTQSVREVWHGEPYQRHRQEMREVMLMEDHVLRRGRRFECTAPGCWAHDACVLANNLADRPFYQQAHDRLERLRRRPLLRAARAANSVVNRMATAVR
jgi:MoaA/NifB/PqqE/SkfB family radical SAM enzyme